MLTDDALDGRSKPDLDRQKEIKVKVPVRTVLSLHYLKMVEGKEMSATVAQALTDYFEEHGTGAAQVADREA